MKNKKLFSAVLATLVILSIVAGSTVAFAQTATPTTNATKNVTKGAVASAAASKAAGFLGLPGFEAVYGVAGLLAVAYLVMRRRN